jgi:hypothetical protein
VAHLRCDARDVVLPAEIMHGDHREITRREDFYTPCISRTPCSYAASNYSINTLAHLSNDFAV